MSMPKRGFFSRKEIFTVSEVEEGFLTALIIKSPQFLPELMGGLQATAANAELPADRVTAALRHLRGAGLIEAEGAVRPDAVDPDNPAPDETSYRYSITEHGTRYRQEQVAQTMGNAALGELPDGLSPA